MEEDEKLLNTINISKIIKEKLNPFKSLREKAFFIRIFRESDIGCESDKFGKLLPLPSVCRNKACRMTALKSSSAVL